MFGCFEGFGYCVLVLGVFGEYWCVIDLFGDHVGVELVVVCFCEFYHCECGCVGFFECGFVECGGFVWFA